jgi:hypothetical protein
MKLLFGTLIGAALALAFQVQASPLATSTNEAPIAGGIAFNPWLAAQPLNGKEAPSSGSGEFHPLILTGPGTAADTSLHFSSADAATPVTETVAIPDHLGQAFETSGWTPDAAPTMAPGAGMPTKKGH